MVNGSAMKLLALLLFFPAAVFGQNDSLRLHRISVGVIYSPDYCYRTLKADASVKFIADERNDYEIPEYGFTTGLSLLIHAGKRLTFETGIQYSDKGYQTKKFDMTWNQPAPSLPEKVSYHYHYNYFDIPFTVSYLFAGSKGVPLHFMKKIMRKGPVSDIGFFISGGASANVFLRQQATATFGYSDGHTSDTKLGGNDFDRINPAFTGGIGMSYFITSRLHTRIEPVFRYSITPIKNLPIKEHLYSAGVNAGIYYTL
jgi:hypothetical protein